MKQLESNKQKSLEKLLKLAEYTAHIPERREKELLYLDFLERYKKEGYNTNVLDHNFAEYIVRVNIRQKELINKLEIEINNMDDIRIVSKYMTIINQRTDLTKDNKAYLLDKAMTRVEFLKK